MSARRLVSWDADILILRLVLIRVANADLSFRADSMGAVEFRASSRIGDL